jgi:FG-GAP-like repeat
MTCFASPVRCLILAVLVTCASPVGAVVNPSLQPNHLMERYLAVFAGEVGAMDAKERTFTLRVTEVFKGDFAPKEVRIDASTDAAATGFSNVKVGQAIVVFAGKARRKQDFMLYCGNGKWGTGEMSAEDPAKWTWNTDPDQSSEEGKGAATMWGTFAGREDRLVELMRDQARGTAFFNAIPTISFDNDLVVGQLDGPARGMALNDLDGDGRPDVVATSEKGVKVWLQREAKTFTDATADLGLADVKAVSVSIADATGSGRKDLLFDGAIWLCGADKKYSDGKLIPSDAKGEVLSSAFVEINGDGWPDVVISRVSGGLSVFQNPGTAGGPFKDITKEAGLDKAECGAGGSGYFAPAPPDWDGGKRTGIWYSSGSGFLLRQNDKGVFSPLAFDMLKAAKPPFFDLPESRVPGRSGGAVFAALWTSSQPSLFLPLDNDFRTAFWEKDKLVDATPWANELSERAYYQLFSIAEDLDMDGTIDTWTASRDASGASQNTCHVNRGYGSWMRPEKYKRADRTDVFNSEAHLKGAGGAAAGDADGDACTDLLIGNLDGSLSLLISDLMLTRKVKVPYPLYHPRKLSETGIVSVHVIGRQGVIGATVSVETADGRTVGRRDIGSNVATGCSGPDTVDLAVREPGACKVHVRFSDGATLTLPVEVKSLENTKLVADRSKAKP